MRLMIRAPFSETGFGLSGDSSSKVWSFPPATTWALFSDGLANAQLRGSFALEHSFFVPLGCLVEPTHSPVQFGRGPMANEIA